MPRRLLAIGVDHLHRRAVTTYFSSAGEYVSRVPVTVRLSTVAVTGAVGLEPLEVFSLRREQQLDLVGAQVALLAVHCASVS